MFTAHEQQIRERFLAAPLSAPPSPWRSSFTPLASLTVGGLLGLGFATDPVTGRDLAMVVSQGGHGLFDAVTGALLARDRDPAPDVAEPSGPSLTCPGLGPLAGTAVPIAGLHGGGLHAATADGWTLDVVSPDWPHHRVLLATDGGLYHGPTGHNWWHIHHATHAPLRACGFSPSGRTMAIATNTELLLLTRIPRK